MWCRCATLFVHGGSTNAETDGACSTKELSPAPLPPAPTCNILVFFARGVFCKVLQRHRHESAPEPR